MTGITGNLFVFIYVVRQNYDRNSDNRGYHKNRNQSKRHWNSNVRYIPQWRWVKQPHDNWRYSSQDADHSWRHSSQDADRQRHHSDEQAANRHAGSSSGSCHPVAESVPPSDSLTSKLTERTSTIISDVLSGKGNANAEKYAKMVPVQSNKPPARNTPNAPRMSSSGQLKHPEQLPSDKPKNTDRGSELSDAGRQKSTTPSAFSRGNSENAVVPCRIQPIKSPQRSNVLFRTGADVQTSLVRMATAPRCRREELELERMIHEHAKKSAATKERVHELQPSASGTSISAGTNSAQNMPQPADFRRPNEGTSSSSANSVIVIGGETGNSSVTNIHDSTVPSSSGAIQPTAATTTGPRKSVKKPSANKNKPKTTKVPKAKVLKAKNARTTGTKNQAGKANKKPRNFNGAYGRGQRPGNSVPVPFIGAGGFCSSSQVPSLLGLDLSGLGSLGVLQNVMPGLVNSQHVLSPSSSQTASSLPATPSASQVTEQGPLSTLLQMSLHEEDVCGKLSQCSSEIEQLQYAIAKLDEELQKRVQLKATVSFYSATVSFYSTSSFLGVFSCYF